MMQGNYFRTAVILMMTFGLLLPAPLAHAAERMTLTYIVASHEGDDFDLDNDAYRDQLIQLFNYSSYHQINQEAVTLEFNTPQTLTIPGDYSMVLTLKNCEDTRCIVRSEIQKNDISYVDTVISILKPGMFFMGGPKTGSGDLIIVLEIGF